MVLLLQATPRAYDMRCWYGLRATALQSKVGGHCHGLRRGHHRARFKGIFIKRQSLDHG